jgi:simple sugar transport system permease protein
MGWDGVVVAIIGQNNPILIVFASLFLSYLRVGGQVLNISSSVPAETVNIIQSIIMILITATAFMASWKNRVLIRRSLSARGLK